MEASIHFFQNQGMTRCLKKEAGRGCWLSGCGLPTDQTGPGPINGDTRRGHLRGRGSRGENGRRGMRRLGDDAVLRLGRLARPGRPSMRCALATAATQQQ
jgi:hypothetical protein